MGCSDSLSAHAASGDMVCTGGAPDCLVPDCGPVYLEGRLVLSLSFQGGPVAVRTGYAGDLVERYRLWDDLGEAWHGSGLEVLRFEQADVVARSGSEPAVLWAGAVDTRARVVPVPDLDEEGMVANEACDLRWRLA